MGWSVMWSEPKVRSAARIGLSGPVVKLLPNPYEEAMT